jgi:hypothetical protein
MMDQINTWGCELMQWNFLSYMTLGGPFLVVLLDLIRCRDIARPRKWLGLLACLFGLVLVHPLLTATGDNPWPYIALVPGLVLLIHSGRMRGLGQFLAFWGWVMLCASLILHLSDNFNIGEIAAIPLNIGFFLIPPLLIWHLWLVLPLAYDALRGGNWSPDTVPLVARYRILALIAVVSLLANIWLYWQWGDYRAMARQQAGNALYSMHSQLKYVDHYLTYRDQEGFSDWEVWYTEHVQRYAKAAYDVAHAVQRKSGVSDGSPLYFFAYTVPHGLTVALEREAELSDAGAAEIKAVLAASIAALEGAINSRNPLAADTYQDAFDQVLDQLESMEDLAIFQVPSRQR